ncbi:hypothetical protein [Mesorhizobium sp.]|uniref:hypothetical protein n=1 Tax=Mesorhizobium sp. TaxID=1871066 RepID=UPI0012023560|nr:hypothetical protein [Mesorhizobium sp.]TIQ94812.1 MAG: hypothetical protein E5X36_24790 [Mesorhizobium sp.]
MNFGYARRVDKGIGKKNDRESLPVEVKLRRREFPMLSIDGSSRHLDAAQSAECEPIAHNGQRTPNKAPHLVQRKDLQVKAEQNRTGRKGKACAAKKRALRSHSRSATGELDPLRLRCGRRGGLRRSMVLASSGGRKPLRTVLELLFFVGRNSGRKTASHFLELLFFLGRNSGRKTASHFLELLSGQM